MAEHCRMWRVWQRFMDPERFVFIDETGTSTNMVRRYGWAPRGERLVQAAPHGHWRTTTFVAGVADAIRAKGASVLYLPPYSPDLNPTEQMFAKLKALLRSAAARTRDALWTTISQILDQFSPVECRNYLTNSGYELS